MYDHQSRVSSWDYVARHRQPLAGHICAAIQIAAPSLAYAAQQAGVPRVEVSLSRKTQSLLARLFQCSPSRFFVVVQHSKDQIVELVHFRVPGTRDLCLSLIHI